MKTSQPGRSANPALLALFAQQLARMSQMQQLMSVQLQQLSTATRPRRSQPNSAALVSAADRDSVATAVATPAAVVATPAVTQLASESIWLPMTSAQRRLYLLCQQPAAELSYHITSLTELVGPLDTDKLQQTMQALVARHQVLRTSLHQQQLADSAELFWQQIWPAASFTLQILDWRQQQPDQIAAGLQALLQPFELTTAPLARVWLLQLASDQHLLLTDFHHAISDGFSLSVFVRELLQLYQGEALPAVSQQYGDYLQWEQQYRQSARYQQDAAYWQQQQLTARPPTELPLCHSRPARQSFHGGRLFSALDARLTEALKHTARQQRVSLFMLLLAGCQLWLSRLCRQQEIQLGVPAVVRGDDGAEHTMGMYTNTLVLQQDIDEQQTLPELLQQVRSRCVGAYQHQAFPFEDLLQEQSARQQTNARNPLFDVMFVYENAQDRQLNLPGLQVRDRPFDPGVSSFDLCLELIEQQGQVTLNLHYASALFATDILQHWLDALLALYQSITEQPQAQLCQLGWLSARQRQLLQQFQQPPAVDPACALPQHWRNWPIQRWVEHQAAQQPEQIAVVYQQQHISYRTLEQQANQLAHLLLSSGVTAQQRIGISLPRGPWLAIAWLAVLKAGAVFVPVDPDYPASRIAHILTDSQATLLLSESSVSLTLPPGCQRLDLDLLALHSFADTVPPGSDDLQQLIYLVYTSGTTGLPKGAQLQHLGINRLLWQQIPQLGLAPGCRVLQFASFSFDAGLVEFFWALCSGATLYMYPSALTRDPAALDEAVNRDQLTHALLTPALLPYLNVDAWRSVTTLVIGGEACPDAIARRWAADRRLLNSYGPTEASIYCTQGRLWPDDSRMQMGGSVAEAQLYVVDARLQLVPPGVPGELLIGGPGVGAGYWQRPELTREKFIENPFAAGRLYRSGDLVRWLPDGQLQYIGRIDQQVKLRGFRIELAEIEAVLLAQPQVQEAAVRIIGSGATAELIGYLAVPAPVRETIRETVRNTVREALRAALPDYMVPSALVLLDKLPLTANGKLDKQALPLPAESDYQRTCYVAPQSDTEVKLAACWQQLLQVNQVGRHDNFYALGGHSLLAVRLLAEIRQQWPQPLTLADVIGSADLAEMASRLEQAADADSTLAAAALPPLQALPAQPRYPLSASQQRLWFVERWSAGQSMYHVPLVWLLAGPFDAARADQALVYLVRRHQPLHFGLSEDDAGQLWQQPLSVPASVLQTLDVRALDDVAVQQRVAALLAQPFDLATDLKLRAWYLQQGEQQGLLVLNLHHIATDGWSMAVLATEFASLYQALAERELPLSAATADAPLLPALPLQYSDYVLWQQSDAVQQHWQQQLSFWQQTLAGAPPVHQLPLDFERPEQPGQQGGWLAFTLTEADSQALVQFARQQQVSLFTVLLTAFYLLLAKYSQSRDLVIGTPVANRAQPELAHLAGFFVNTLVLRQQLDPDWTVSTLLHQVQQQVALAQQHQEYPFEKLVEALQPVRQSQYSPLFQIMFSMDPPGLADMQLGDLHLRKAAGAEQQARFELTLEASTEQSAFAFAFEYNSELFSAVTIERLADSYQTLLTQLLRQAASPAAQQLWVELDAVSPAQQQLLSSGRGGNEAVFAWPAEPAVTVLSQLAALVQQQPQQAALVQGDSCLSYQQLWQHSHIVAAALAQQGIGAGAVVALCLDRSIPLLVTVLALLRLGAVYLPLDPAYPAARLQQIIEDAKPALICLQDSQPNSFTKEYAGRTLLLTQCWADWFSEPQAARLAATELPLVSPAADAYLIYTSGSTGTPKGVLVAQPQLLHLAQAMQQAYQLTAQDRVLQFSSINFDISIEEIFASWCSGACLVLREAHWLDSPAHFWQLVQQHQLSVLNLPTAFWSELTSALPDWFAAALRLVIIGGEAAPLPQVRRWLDSSARHIALINAYGPTETTVTATCYTITAVQPRQQQIPLGRPVGANRCYILDAQRRLLPPGAIGDLWIAGPGVSRGYLRRPEQTAAVFCPQQLPGSTESEIWYHSGDLARWNSDGQLEFFGRRDEQVKLNGFRIELADIEAQILQFPAVDSALVVADQSAGQQSWRLLAYLRATQPIDVAALRQHLSHRLPQFMLPAAIRQLTEWPLMPNGKIDRKALPQPDEQAFLPQAGEPPAAGIEQQLADLWQQLLGVHVQSRTADFFALGGHSLLSIRLLALIRRQFGRELVVRDIFRHSTLAAMAALLDDHSPQWPELAVRPADSSEWLPLSFSQQRLWFIEQLQPGSAQYHISATLQLDEPLEADLLEKAANQLTAQHQILRTVLLQQAEQSWQRVQADVQFRLTRLQASDQSELQQLAQHHAQQPFDLSQDLLWRLALVQCEGSQYLLFNLHHIAGDGWSVNLLINGLLQGYHQLQRAALLQSQAPSQTPSEPEPVPALPLQYADYALWQHQLAAAGYFDQAQQYFADTLAQLPPVHALPLDYARPPVWDEQGASVSASLSKDELQALQQFARSHQASLFSLCHAAFAHVLARFSGQSDIVIGTPVLNRPQAVLQPLVGFFVNTLVLRLDCTPSQHFTALLEQSRQQLHQAQQYQDYPFELLVAMLNPPREAAIHPLFQIFMSMDVSDDSELTARGITLLPVNQPPARFDLSLNLQQQQNGLQLRLDYACALFRRSSIQALLDALLLTLRLVRTDALRPLERLPVLNSEQQQQLLAAQPQVSEHRAGFARRADFLAHWQQQQRHYADQIAVADAQQALSYQQLEQGANQLAHALLAAGLQSAQRVALLLKRDAQLPLTILALWKLGCAYVPLDPSQPPARLQAILADADVALTITSRCYQALAQQAGAGRLWLSDAINDGAEDGSKVGNHDALQQQPPVQSQPVTAPQLELPTDPLAYLIYTSGSTGQPKGVQVYLSSVFECLQQISARIEFLPQQAMLAITTVTFDISVLELWLPLLAGGHTVLMPTEDARDPQLLQQWLERFDIRWLQATPATWQGLLLSGWRSNPGLSMLCGGEALSLPLAQQLLAGGGSLWNVYGPTEATIWVSAARIRSTADFAGQGVAPVAGLLPGIRSYVLSPAGLLQPPGAAGELYLSGPCVAAGYRNRPELTARHFLPDPFVPHSQAMGQQMYRTGDLVRQLPGGELAFLGRIDHQVKINGFRIELGDIESQLRQHPAIEQAVALALPVREQLMLVLYWQRRPNVSVSESQLRSWLAQQLPAYMQPGYWLELAEFPLNSNGKIDRKALPPPQLQQQHCEPPATATELQLQQIYQQVLAQDVTDVTASFFALGGHSLLSIKLIQQLNQHGKQAGWPQLSLADLFSHADIRSLAALLDSGLAVAAQQHDQVRWVTLEPQAGLPDWWLIPGAGAVSSAMLPLARLLRGRAQLRVAEPQGRLGVLTPHQDWASVSADYLAALKQQQPQGPYRIAGHSLGGRIAYQLACALEAAGEQVTLCLLDVDLQPAVATGTLSDAATEMYHLLCRALGQPAASGDEPSDYRAALVALMQQAGLLPQQDWQSELDALLAIATAQAGLYQQFRPGPKFYGESWLIYGDEFAVTHPRASLRRKLKQYLQGRLKLQQVDGDHLTMLSAPALADCLAALC